MHESRQIMIDYLMIYSDGLDNGLKKEKLVETREYAGNMKGLLDDIGKYVEASISYKTVERQYNEPRDKTGTDAERAMDAAKRAQEILCALTERPDTRMKNPRG